MTSHVWPKSMSGRRLGDSRHLSDTLNALSDVLYGKRSAKNCDRVKKTTNTRRTRNWVLCCMFLTYNSGRTLDATVMPGVIWNFSEIPQGLKNGRSNEHPRMKKKNKHKISNLKVSVDVHPVFCFFVDDLREQETFEGQLQVAVASATLAGPTPMDNFQNK